MGRSVACQVRYCVPLCDGAGRRHHPNQTLEALKSQVQKEAGAMRGRGPVREEEAGC